MTGFLYWIPDGAPNKAQQAILEDLCPRGASFTDSEGPTGGGGRLYWNNGTVARPLQKFDPQGQEWCLHEGVWCGVWLNNLPTPASLVRPPSDKKKCPRTYVVKLDGQDQPWEIPHVFRQDGEVLLKTALSYVEDGESVHEVPKVLRVHQELHDRVEAMRDLVVWPMANGETPDEETAKDLIKLTVLLLNHQYAIGLSGVSLLELLQGDNVSVIIGAATGVVDYALGGMNHKPEVVDG
jgi:hypothetical protein